MIQRFCILELLNQKGCMINIVKLIAILDFLQCYQGFLEESIRNRDTLQRLLNISLSGRF